MRGHRLKSDEGAQPWSKLMDHLSVAAKVRSTGGPSSGSGTASAASAVQTWEVFAGGPVSRQFSYFGEYILYDRVAGTPQGTSGFLDGYVQYTGSASSADRFWWVRSGRLYPFAVYALGAGGRTTLSRSRLVTDKLNGLLPALQRRSLGVSAGYASRAGLRLEAGVQRGSSLAQNAEKDASLFLSRPDVFVTAEQTFDNFGTALGLYGRTGWINQGSDDSDGHDGSNSSSRNSRQRFTQSGVLGRYVNEHFVLSGTYIMSQVRDGDGQVQRPAGYFLEAARNLKPELTGFMRYDSLAGAAATTSDIRTRGIVVGVSQRLPGSGRLVFEWGHDLSAGALRKQSALLDVVVMY